MSHRTTRQQKARALQAETGWNYMRALTEVDRRYAEAQANEQQFSEDLGTLQRAGLNTVQLAKVMEAGSGTDTEPA